MSGQDGAGGRRARPTGPLLPWLLALAAVLNAGCGASEAGGTTSLARDADDPWVGPRLAGFMLTERSGREIALEDLAGHPFVLDFVFTTCAGPCPLMSAGMRALQDHLASTSVRLVSVTVDPRIDTLEVLRGYADRLSADPERWLFLRGAEPEIETLAASVSLALRRDPSAGIGFQVAHSTRLIVVDGAGQVRGYYEGTSPEGRAQAAARARWLEGR